MARLFDRNNIDHGKHGQLIDATADRIQETGLGLIRQNRADNLYGRISAVASTVTSPLPSLVRAIAESRSIIVPESGNNPIGFIGTRFARSILGITSTCFPRTQSIIDTVQTVGNITTTVQRIKAVKTKLTSDISTQNKEKAGQRAIVLGCITGIALISTALNLINTTKKH
jgi:hypothetical protein